MTEMKHERPTKEKPIDVSERRETWTAEDGTKFAHNLDTKGKDFTWLFSAKQGRFQCKILHKKVVQSAPPEKNQGGYFAEKEYTNVFNQLEVWMQVKGEDRYIRVNFSPMEGRQLLGALLAIDETHGIFNADNPRRDAQ